jgi:hypothetical protein
VHLIQFRQIQAIPEYILGAEKRTLMLAGTISTRNLFALLNIER